MCNEAYLEKAKSTIKQIRKVGKYKGDIVLIIGDDLKDKNLVIEGVIVKYFPNIEKGHVLELLKDKPISDGREISKVFQWHKIHVFDTYFKQWEKCIYIDAGMHIFKPVGKIVNLKCDNKLLAHSDAYATYEWKLKDQFDNKYFPELYSELYHKYDLERDYFQSGVLIYDTNIIDANTKNELISLSDIYINTKSNEQGIMNIYFNCIKNIWEPIQTNDAKTHYYDCLERFDLKHYNYIMLKYPQTLGYNRYQHLISKKFIFTTLKKTFKKVCPFFLHKFVRRVGSRFLHA
jgi:hypothetical protein